MRSSFVLRRNKDRRVFIYYSIYAWGAPLLWTTITILIDQHKWVSDAWSPTMAQYGNICWFSRKYHHPQMWAERVNRNSLSPFIKANIGVDSFCSSWCQAVYTFSWTLSYSSSRRSIAVASNPKFIACRRHPKTKWKRAERVSSQIRPCPCKSVLCMIRWRFSSNCSNIIVFFRLHRFIMNIKLFIVMGVSWIIEILTTFSSDPDSYLNIADIFNIFQGVLVFFIFVFKRKVLHELQQKLGTYRLSASDWCGDGDWQVH